MKTLIVGGAGYIGNVTARLMRKAGHAVHIIDDFSTGHIDYVEDFGFTDLNILETSRLLNIIKSVQPDVVLHFAAKIQVAESVEKPDLYFENNTSGTLSLMSALLKTDCRNIVFSSTAAVYGEPENIPIFEDASKKPVNPYGLSKYLSEQVLGSYGFTHSFNWVAFRYFNAAGAYEGVAMDYPVMTHLIPHAVEAYIDNRQFKLFGDDYDTLDGTCIRDFVHVIDIAKAHVIAAENMFSGQEFKTAINLGSGNGFSVKQVVETLDEITGEKLSVTVLPRRAGDPSKLIASCKKAEELLGWKPSLKLEDMVSSHLKWRIEK